MNHQKNSMLSFIVQARLGSTRLPNKILLPFYNGRSIFDLMLDKLQSIQCVDCIVATSDSPVNDTIEAICDDRGIKCFRGSENDVLQRFIGAADRFGVSQIIRVCSDNPFLNVPAIRELVSASEKSEEDYISFSVNGTPSIKTHYGFWTEYVTLSALKKVSELTDESLFHEHVTNYIYSHPCDFSIKWLGVPDCISSHGQTRLTIDTPQDFVTASRIYGEIDDRDSFECLFNYIDTHPDLSESMKTQIINNSK